MAAKSMVFSEVGPLVVTAHSSEVPTDEAWEGYLQLCRKKMGEERFGALAVTAGGAPTTKQRADLRELLRGLRHSRGGRLRRDGGPGASPRSAGSTPGSGRSPSMTVPASRRP